MSCFCLFWFRSHVEYCFGAVLLETHPLMCRPNTLSSSRLLQYGLLSGGGDELYPLPAPGGVWMGPPSRDWCCVSFPPCHLCLVAPHLQRPLAPPGKHGCLVGWRDKNWTVCEWVKGKTLSCMWALRDSVCPSLVIAPCFHLPSDTASTDSHGGGGFNFP